MSVRARSQKAPMALRWPALRIRLLVVLLAVAATALVPHPGPGLLGFAAIGTVVAVVVPAYGGALLLLLAEIVGWTVAYGLDASPPVVRTVPFAVVLYLLHSVTALAASVPAAADVRPEIVRLWAVRCLPGVAAAALAGAVVNLLGRVSGSLALDVAGLAAAVVVLGVLVWSGRSLDRRDAS